MALAEDGSIFLREAWMAFWMLASEVSDSSPSSKRADSQTETSSSLFWSSYVYNLIP